MFMDKRIKNFLGEIRDLTDNDIIKRKIDKFITETETQMKVLESLVDDGCYRFHMMNIDQFNRKKSDTISPKVKLIKALNTCFKQGLRASKDCVEGKYDLEGIVQRNDIKELRRILSDLRIDQYNLERLNNSNA